jgi:hypothetical protein
MKRALIVAACVALRAVAVPAQTPLPTIEPGTRIRVVAFGVRETAFIGEFARSTADTIVIVRGTDSVRFAWTYVTRVQERGRRRGAGPLKGAGWGFLVGLAGGFAIGLIVDPGGPGEGQIVRAAPILAVVGAVLGPPTGAMVAAVRRRERWRTTWERR